MASMMGLTGCAHYLPIRVSSQTLDAADAEATMARPEAEVRQALEVTMQGRGFPLANQIEVSP